MLKKSSDGSKSSGGYTHTFARTLPDTTKILGSITTLLEAYRWKRFSLIYGSTSPWTEIVSQFKQVIKKRKDMVINHKTSAYAGKQQMLKIVKY